MINDNDINHVALPQVTNTMTCVTLVVQKKGTLQLTWTQTKSKFDSFKNLLFRCDSISSNDACKSHFFRALELASLLIHGYIYLVQTLIVLTKIVK